MDWQEAFLKQAQSDYQVYLELAENPRTETCHLLHYLQMLTEKLAKGFAARTGKPPPTVHAGFVRFLRDQKTANFLQPFCGIKSPRQYRAYLESILPLARQIETLAPTSAGRYAPNPEYPWFDRLKETVVAPADYHFADFAPSMPKMIKLNSFLKAAFAYLNES